MVLAAGLSGCIRTVASSLPRHAAAYQVLDKAAQSNFRTDYPLAAGDKVRVNVFQEPDLSADQLLVDPGGNVSLPLLGTVHAAGLSPRQLEAQIQTALGARYLRNPQVSVTLSEAVAQMVSVEGEVKQPGVYPITPGSTLLSAIAQAKSPTLTAKLDEVLIFRTVQGERMGARFDIAMIRAGKADDPVLLPNDVVVVGYSRVLGAYRDLLQTVPLLSVFRRY
ncbi:MAG: hypothetical protein RIS94_783 [Pseudomonadota bacterium]